MFINDRSTLPNHEPRITHHTFPGCVLSFTFCSSFRLRLANPNASGISTIHFNYTGPKRITHTNAFSAIG
jgi:hypothetical protein